MSRGRCWGVGGSRRFKGCEVGSWHTLANGDRGISGDSVMWGMAISNPCDTQSTKLLGQHVRVKPKPVEVRTPRSQVYGCQSTDQPPGRLYEYSHSRIQIFSHFVFCGVPLRAFLLSSPEQYPCAFIEPVGTQRQSVERRTLPQCSFCTNIRIGCFQMARLRRPHTKSRKGCKECKRRKIKVGVC